MSEEVEVKTSDDVMRLVFKLTQFEMNYPRWAKTEALRIVNQEIVDKIRDKMEVKGYSKKISERVRTEFVAIDTDGFIEIDIISDFETNEGFDVAKMMEDGRVRYFVEPVIKKALHWIKQGVSWFSGGHWIPERPGDKFVKDVMDEMEDLAQEQLNTKTDELLNYQLEN